MNSQNFNHWLSRRDNEVNEGIFDWLFGKKKQNLTNPDPDDPTVIDREIYNNPLVSKYVTVIIRHLGLNKGTTLQKVDPNTNTPQGEITIGDIHSEMPEFYKALQRFVAGHIIGGGEEKSYLRISQHDAITIVNTLDRLRRPGENQSIADALHIDDLNSLVNWIQTRVPTAQTAKLQQGFGQAQSDFMAGRVARGKGNPLGHPLVKGLVDASKDAVNQGLKKRHYTRGLLNALIRVNNELAKMGVVTTPIESRKKDNPTAPSPTGGVPGVPGRAKAP